jgi:hypothetical protein
LYAWLEQMRFELVKGLHRANAAIPKTVKQRLSLHEAQ